MRKPVWAWIAAALAVVTLAVMTAAAQGDLHWVRRHLSPVRPQAAPVEILLVPDGSQEAGRALERIQQALDDEGCQLGIQVRVAGDGALEPRITVEWCRVTAPAP